MIPNLFSEEDIPLPDPPYTFPELPEPSQLASNLPATGTTDFDQSIDFLFRGEPPIQRDVDEDYLDRNRLGVIRGRVLDLAGQPLSGVRIHIGGHSEFGYTYSRTDGMFDIVVNGGGQLNVTYHRPGYVMVQRPMRAQWNDYTIAPDIVMTPLNSKGSLVDFARTPRLVIASDVDDERGKRRAALFFPEGTRAEMVFDDGERQALGKMVVRPTELTTGELGPEAMPGALPNAVAYTYATSFTVDEVIALDANRVEFDRTAYMYVDNFLGFPTGQATPSAYYDYQRATWVPENNGRVITILDAAQGSVSLDLDGSAFPASAEALRELGITSTERAALAQMFGTGDSFWRIPITHLTPYDINWPFRLPDDADRPDVNVPSTDRPTKVDCHEQGSIIDTYQQTLMQVLPLAGTSTQLVYSSARTPGRLSPIDVALHDDDLPESLRSIVVDVNIRGKQFHRKFTARNAPRRTTFLWNGEDSYGRMIQGESMATVRLRYIYEAEYGEPPPNERSFGLYERPNGAASATRAQPLLSMEQTWSIPLHRWVVKEQDLAGWSLDIHHRYDRIGRTLIMGSGEDHQLDPIQFKSGNLATGTRLTQITAAEDSGARAFDQSEAFADEVRLPRANRMLVGPDGSLYVVEQAALPTPDGQFKESGILRISTDGLVERYAGRGRVINASDRFQEHCGKFVNPIGGCAGNDGPALEAEFHTITDLAIGLDGALYVLDAVEGRVRRIGSDGIITAVTGPWSATHIRRMPSQGLQASDVYIGNAHRMAMADDGGFFLAKQGEVFRVMPDGSFYKLTGDEDCESTAIYDYDCDADGRRIDELNLGIVIRDMASSTDGTLYLLTSTRLYRLRRDGRIETLLLLPVEMHREIGGEVNFAAQSLGLHVDDRDRVFLFSYSMQPGHQDGQVYLFDQTSKALTPRMGFKIPAGSQPEPWSLGFHPAEGRDALRSAVAPTHVAAGPDGELYVLDALTQAIYLIGERRTMRSSAEAHYIPSPDGQLLFVFNRSGRHLYTLNAKDQSLVHQFAYDDAERLITAEDAFGNQLTIERDAQGNARALIAPLGQRTELEINDDAWLAAVINPNNEVYSFEYTPEGLMTGWNDPLGRTKTYAFDSTGRLNTATNPLGDDNSLTRKTTDFGFEVLSTSPEGRTERYQVEWLDDGSAHYIVTDAAGMQSSKQIDRQLHTTQTTPDGTRTSTQVTPDPRFGMRAPYLSRTITTTPSGLSRDVTQALDVVLAVPGDPDTLTSLTRTLTLSRDRVLTTQYALETDGAVLRATTPAGRALSARLDDKGRPIEVNTPGLVTAEFTYDERGRINSIKRGARKLDLSYDPRGFINAWDNQIDAPVTFNYDPVGRLTSLHSGDQHTISFDYDAAGNLIELHPPGTEPHGLEYTPLDQVASYNPPNPGLSAHVTSFTYDRDRLLRRVIYPDGQELTYDFDDAQRLVSLDAPGGVYSFEYDERTGHQNAVDGPDGRAVFHHDGPLLTQTQLPRGLVSWTYDDDFQIISEAINDAHQITFAYDEDGLLTRVGTLELANHPDHGLITGATLHDLATTWTRNTYGEATTARTTLAGRDIYRYDLTFDDLGRITGKDETIAGQTTRWAYTFDATGRLTAERRDGVLTQSFVYDDNGNRITHVHTGAETAATYDAQDRLITYGDFDYTFNHNGTLLNLTNTTLAETTTYDYDVFGHLRAVDLPDGTSITYTIDPLDRRDARYINGTFDQGWIYKDALNPIAEVDAQGAVVSRFVYGAHPYVPDYIVQGNRTLKLITDHLGSVRLVVDVATGDVAQRLDYDAFGRVLSDTNPGFQPFGFAGGLYDHHTGLVRFGARDYDAYTGRWTAKDPVGFRGGDTNLYGYVFQNPVNWIDPTGQWAFLLPLAPHAARAFAGATVGGISYGISAAISGKGSASGLGKAMAIGAAAGVGGGLLGQAATGALTAGGFGTFGANIGGGAFAGGITSGMAYAADARWSPCPNFTSQGFAMSVFTGTVAGATKGLFIAESFSPNAIPNVIDDVVKGLVFDALLAPSEIIGNVFSGLL